MSVNGDGMLFSAPMVRAIEKDRKTQTRRTLYMLRKGDEKAQRRAVHLVNYPAPNPITTMDLAYYYDLRHMLKVGEQIWVRESWRADVAYDDVKPSKLPKTAAIRFEADGMWKGMGAPGKLRPSIFLPRQFSRTTLTVTEVRIERLQDISEEDARAEGAYVAPASGRVADDYVTMAIAGVWFSTARGWYAFLWDCINGAGSWDANPWVIAYTFTVAKQPIDG